MKRGGRKASAPRSQRPSKGRQEEEAPLPRDRVDEFMEQRGHIALSGAAAAVKGRKQPDANVYLDLSSGSASAAGSADEDDEQSGSSSEREMIRARALAGSDDDDDNDGNDGNGAGEDGVQNQSGLGWGKNKHVYYQQDEDEVSSSEGERLEEEEARRIQAKRTAQMSEADFMELPRGGPTKPQAAQQPKRNKKVRADAVEVERVAASDGDAADAVAPRAGDNEELSALLLDVRAKVADVRTTLQPLLEWLEASGAAEQAQSQETRDGISFVRMRYQLLLAYCTNLLFYTLLKTQGAPVKDHPVVEQLVRLRLMLDKTRGIDEKLQPQIKRLLRTAALGVEALEGDAASARANARAMLEDDDGDQVAGGADAGDNGQGVYVPPKRSVAYMDEDDRRLEKRERKQQRAQERAQRSGIMRMVEEEFGEGPETRSSQLHVLEADEADADDAERAEYEREHFVRLGKVKGKPGRSGQYVDDLRELDNFGDVSRVLTGEGTGTLSVMAQRLRERQGELAGAAEDPEDEAYRAQQDDIRERDEAAEAAYDQFVAESKAKKEAKAASSYAANPNARRAATSVAVEGGKRNISYQMEANRGIMMGAKKDISRVRSKNKFKKALKKRSSMVQSARKESARYEGEATGINVNVVRSSKLK